MNVEWSEVGIINGLTISYIWVYLDHQLQEPFLPFLYILALNMCLQALVYSVSIIVSHQFRGF